MSTTSIKTTTKINRNYENAISNLNSLQSNAATIELIRKKGTKIGLSTIDFEGIEYLSRLGYSVSKICSFFFYKGRVG